MAKVFLGLGSNLGDRKRNITDALNLLAKLSQTELIRCSSIYETEPWGVREQPSFLNCVCEIETKLKPEELLNFIMDIEKKLGRKRTKERYGPRVIDIDILLYEDIVESRENWEIPHPAMHLRRFVLVPLCEIASNFLHPRIKKTVRQLLDECSDALEVKFFSAPPDVNSTAD